ncbi:relaxase/mobilization nuclease domain-containing protein [Mucilaginibacter calamicampi]|uniref:Relaxase/mobilization nuclease domain-containing protein n=1 Tax=Mucilaginibacter calamicampi TaxID=1302352 RepID=A0ABW2YRT9_9SPHI
MVAKIKSGKSLKGALNYNENKVKQGKATLIHAPGFLKDPANMNFYDKLHRLSDLAARNERSKTNTVHISLNFPSGEKLPTERLQQISDDYMQGIGFGDQPYLVYRHTDVGHPHIHIVSTNIKASGERISLHYLGQNQSEKARKAIELKYSLAKAQEQPRQKTDKLKAVKIDYGQAETKRQLTNVINQVIREYKFTSIPEFNAVLQGYHVLADTGARDSRMNAKGGLLYWLTGEQGDKRGVPIKASSIYGQPTLKNLKERFRLNEALRKPLKPGLIQVIDQALKQATAKEFQLALQKQHVEVLFRQNADGRIYGVTFIDHQHKAVFNGSDLGKAYSKTTQPSQPPMVYPETNSDSLIDILFQPEQQDLTGLNKIKKKKRKRQNL